MEFFLLSLFILRCSTTEKIFQQQLPGSFFYKTPKTGIYRLVSIWHRAKFANFSSSKFQNHSGNRVGGIRDSAKNHKRQRRKRQSVTTKRGKSQTPKFV